MAKFDPDHCFDCGAEFDHSHRDGYLPFYTIVIDNSFKRCCPECFPKHQENWMG